MTQETSFPPIPQRNTQISVSVSQSFSSTKSVTTASNSARESASDTFDTITGSNLSDWKTDYGVSLKMKTPLGETKQSQYPLKPNGINFTKQFEDSVFASIFRLTA